MSSPIKFVVVGFGNIGKRHCEEIVRHPDAKLVAICDVDETKEKEAWKTYPVPFFNSLDAFMLSSFEADVISICTPNGFHAPLSLQALNFYTHVVCEKPMALEPADCQAMIDLAKEVDRQIFCVMQNRYSPPSQWLKSVVEQGVLGEVFMVKIDLFWNRDHRYYTPDGWRGTLELDGGPLFTQFSHFVDLLYWLFGDIEDIKAQFYNFNHQTNTEFEDSGLVQFKFKQGGAGAINYSTSCFDKNLESSITILAEKGTIKVSGQYMDRVEHCNIDGYTMPEIPASQPPNLYPNGYQGSASNHLQMVDNVIRSLRGEIAATATPEEGLAVVGMIDRIYALRVLDT